MHITIFIEQIHGGGAERVACNLANYLSEKGHEITILTLIEDKPSYTVSSEIKFQYLRERRSGSKSSGIISRIKEIYLGIKALYRYLKNEKCDCMVAMLQIPIIMSLLLKPLIRTPIVFSERAHLLKYKLSRRLALKGLAHRAKAIVFQTEMAKNDYGFWIGKAKAYVIPNAINQEFIGQKTTWDMKKNYIISVGRLSKQKNFPMLMKAFANLQDKYQNYDLIIYGEGPERSEMLKYADELGIQDRFGLPGYSRNILDELKQAKVFVLASDYEGMPNALMEAMAVGVASISTDCPCGGPSYLIKDGINGMLIPVGDVNSLTDSLDKLLGNDALCKELGQNATHIAVQLSPENIYSSWEKVIFEAAGVNHEEEVS